jgi:hypothetical protein
MGSFFIQRHKLNDTQSNSRLKNGWMLIMLSQRKRHLQTIRTSKYALPTLQLTHQ